MKRRENNQISRLITGLDLAIRSGNIKFARSELLKLNKKEISVRYWYEICDLARRTQMPYFILSWLNPIIRPTKKILPLEPEPKHFALYANALTRIGAFQEAETLFTSILKYSADEPQILFFMALLEIQQWNNKRASNYLHKYLKLNKLSDYQRKVGLLNLASVIGYDDINLTESTVQDLIKSSAGEYLLHANALEILGQSYFHLRDFDKSRAMLNKSISLFEMNNVAYRLYAEKWLLLCDLFQFPEQLANNLNRLSILRQKSVKDKQFETARDCDFFNALVRRDDDFFIRIYYGTRHLGFKNRILNFYNFEKQLPASYELKIEIDKSQGYLLLNPDNGWSVKEQKYFSSKLPLRLFSFLSSDIYMPFHFGEIFSVLYKDEYFNPETSPLKISRIIQRLRSDLTSNNILIEILTEKRQVSLVYHQNISFYRKKTKKIKSKNNDYLLLMKLESQFKLNKFSARQAVKFLEVSNSTGYRILTNLILQKLIKKIPMGKKTLYCINKTNFNKAIEDAPV